MTPESGRSAARPAAWALAAALLLVGSFLLLHGSRMREAIGAYNALGAGSVHGAFGRPVPAPLNRSVFLDGDCYAWVDYAAQIARGETFRVRRNERDNHPFGREVHWSSGFAWALAAAGRVGAALGGGGIDRGIESAAVLINPVLFFLFLAAAAAVTARAFGGGAAAALVLAAGGAGELYAAFYPGRPDHHGLIAAAAFGTVFCLAAGGAGWVRAGGAAASGVAGPGEGAGVPAEDRARRWFVASAVLGGTGFWVSALTQSLVTAIVCAGAAAGSFAVTRAAGEGGPRYRPDLWRLWGRVGAAVSLGFYLLEYFPGHLGWRLEVNHPLYALAWWGCAELLARLLAWRAGEPVIPRGRDLALAALAGAAVAAIPLLVRFGGPRFYLPLDTLWVRMLRMVVEQQPPAPAELLRGLGLLAGAAALSALLLALRRPGRAVASALAFAAVCCLLTLGLALAMRRWVGLLEAMLVQLLAFSAIHLFAGGGAGAVAGALRRAAPALLLAPLLLAQLGLAASRELSLAATLATARTNEFNLLEFAWLRAVAEAIRADAPGGRVVVLSDPGTGEVLSHFGGFDGIASQYWENLEGLRAAADISTARSDAEALGLIRARGITHLVLIRAYEPSRRYFELKHGRWDPSEAFGTFGAKVHVRMLPPWLRVVRTWATAPEFRGLEVEVLRVDPAALGESGPGRGPDS